MQSATTREPLRQPGARPTSYTVWRATTACRCGGSSISARAPAIPARARRRFPRAKTVGVELSSYAAARYGWIESSLVTFEDAAGFDIVVCNDVIQYLDDEIAELALERLAGTRGLLYFTGLTAVDVRETCDPERRICADVSAGAWYRERLARAFVDVGSGVHLLAEAGVPVWELERR